MITKIINGKIITDTVLKDEILYLRDGEILDITRDDIVSDKTVDAKGCYVSPGFIDIHTHGGGGADFMDGGPEPIITGVKAHMIHGTTSIMPTTLSASIESINKSVQDIGIASKLKEGMPNIIGAHLEGPYFSLKQSGAQNPDYIKNPQPDEYEKVLEAGKGIIKRWSFAPELPGSTEFCKTLVNRNIISSVAHSDAVYDDIKRIYDNGCRLITHLYSGMSTIVRHEGFRYLGVIESAYLFDDMKVEVIADGMHLPPELLRLIFKHKGAENICLVTDSMRAAGMGDGKTILGSISEGMECLVEDGVAKLPDRSAFAGSVATADRLVRTFVKQVGVGITDAVRMITINPAEAVGLSKKGRIQKGFDADIIIFDNDINVKTVFVNGKETFRTADF